MGFFRNPVKSLVSAVRSVTGGIAGAIQNVASSVGSAVSNVASAARGITGKIYDEIGSLAQKIGNTVEKIASDPKMLAAVAVNFAFPGAGTAIGEWILGAETAAAVGSAATAAVGNACLNTAMNGGDMQKGVTTAVTSYLGNVGAQQISQYVKNAADVPDALAKNIGTTTSYAAIQAAMGKDPTTALLTGGANACAQLLTQQIPGFDNLPQNAKDALTKTTAAALQNKSGGAVNAAIDYATSFAKDEYNTYQKANNAGFNYDVDAYRDAQQIGITKPEDYKYAKSVGANSVDDFNIAKSINAQDSSDLGLAKTLGIRTADDLNYAKQVDVQTPEDFSFAKKLGVDSKGDLDYAKQIGVQTPDDYDFAKKLGLESRNDFDLAKILDVKTPDDLNLAKQFELVNKEDFDLAKNIHPTDINDFNFAKSLGLKTAEDLDYAKMVGVQNADEYDFAKKVGAKDATDLGVAEKYGIEDKDTLKKYSDFLGHGTEKASTSTFKNQDGSEVTIDNEANIVKYTIPTPNGPMDVTNDIAKLASRRGGYTMVGDDGSTLTINPDGTVSAQDAPQDYYSVAEEAAAGKAGKSKLNAYNVVKLAQQNREQTQASEQGGINEETIAATQRMRENPLNKTGYELTAEDVINLYQELAGPQAYYAPQEEELPTGADVKVGGQFDQFENYLDGFGERPNYLGNLAKGQEMLPGQDQGAPTEGGYTSGPPIGGGGGAGNERQVYGGPLRQSAPTGYQTVGGQNIEDQLRSAGLQDQSAAETQRLLNVQGPMAIGQVPRPMVTAGLPSALKPPVAPTVTMPDQPSVQPVGQPTSIDQMSALAEQIRRMQESSATGLKQIQEYASQAAKTGGTTAQDLLRYMLTKQPEKGAIAYKDAFGNIRTRYGGQ